ncbi:MAG: LytTR family DNA-binding domain-containing protein [Rubricoccaceae bacterium]|nr:LytTR family DNA-binding domain-containing protein [Rubricoccaceae bacterium]
MEPLRTLIADDEPLARETIRLLLDGVPDVEAAWEASDGAEAVEAIEAHAPDLVFLDVQMPALDGFGVIEAVGPGRMPVTVFVTAYDDYALRAFEEGALDYLLKPYDDARFAAALDRARTRVRERRRSEGGDLADRLETLLAGRPGAPEGDAPLDRLLIRDGGRLTVLRAETIDWVEAAGDYQVLHVGPKTHLLRETLSNLTRQLDGRRFVRIHRSTLVNLDRVRELKPYDHGDYLVRLHDGTELRLSRRYWKAVEARLGGLR